MDKIVIDDLVDGIDKKNLSTYYDNNRFEISFLFKSDFKNTKKLRDYLISIFDFLEVWMLWKNRFVLIVDELNNNAIEYWSLDQSVNTLRFEAILKDDNIYINIEVEDAWDWIKTKKASEMEELRKQKLEKWFEDHNSIRWRWLFLIITKIVDELYFKDSKNWWLVVWIKKTVKKW